MRRILACIGSAGFLLTLGLGWHLHAGDDSKPKPRQPVPLTKSPPKADSPKENEALTAPRQEEEQSPLAKFMRKKLAASDQILEGLVTENFGKIGKGAEQLESMSKAEKWRVSNDPIYAQMSREFRRTAKQLQEDAKEATIDAAALTWIKVTMSCIECHKWTKGMLLAGDGN